MNKIIKIFFNLLVYILGILGIVVIAISVLATIAGYGHLNIFQLRNML